MTRSLKSTNCTNATKNWPPIQGFSYSQFQKTNTLTKGVPSVIP